MEEIFGTLLFDETVGLNENPFLTQWRVSSVSYSSSEAESNFKWREVSLPQLEPILSGKPLTYSAKESVYYWEMKK